MAKWLKVKAKMQKLEDLESRERMGLPEIEIESVFNPVVIDMDHIVTYCHSYDNEGRELSDQSEITLSYGGYMTLEIAFVELDKKLRGDSK